MINESNIPQPEVTMDSFFKLIQKNETNPRFLIIFSIAEKILRNYLYKGLKKNNIDYSGKISAYKDGNEIDKRDFEKFSQYMERLNNKLNTPLSNYKKCTEVISKFVNKIKSIKLKLDDIENSVGEVETYLSSHLQENFLTNKSSSGKWDEGYFNESFMKNHLDSINFNYSVCSLGTVLKILKILERQNFSSRDQEELAKLTNKMPPPIITNKLKLNFMAYSNQKSDFSATNIVNKLVETHIKDVLTNIYGKKGELKSYEAENYICCSLFFINKIIKDYPFYFEKKPDLETIFISLKKFKK